MKTYEEVRSVAKDGDIVFLTVNRRDYLSRLTSWFTTSPFTHAAFVFWYNERLLMVESTTHGGIRIVLASTYSDRTWDILPAVKPWATSKQQRWLAVAQQSMAGSAQHTLASESGCSNTVA
jgi:hypothetical protein